MAGGVAVMLDIVRAEAIADHATAEVLRGTDGPRGPVHATEIARVAAAHRQYGLRQRLVADLLHEIAVDEDRLVARNARGSARRNSRAPVAYQRSGQALSTELVVAL